MWLWPFGKKEDKVKKHRFAEEYKDYVNRKRRERTKPEEEILKDLPELEEIKKRSDKVEKESVKKNFIPEWIKFGISGFDDLIEKGIPKGSAILIAGGPGSGKTIFCLQTLYQASLNREKCLYISFEESSERLKQHMRDFGWNVDDVEARGFLKIFRVDPFKISRSVEALLAEAKGELLIRMEQMPELIPKKFQPNRIVLDSLSALGAAFSGRETHYRIYIEQLFRFFERIGVTSFLISETDQIPTSYSRTGVEEFLADGVIVFYNVKRKNSRVRAVEILKMRGAKHEKKIVPFEITNAGMIVYPTEPVFMEE